MRTTVTTVYIRHFMQQNPCTICMRVFILQLKQIIMSTYITKVNGVEDGGDNGSIELIRFYGGDKRGRLLQLNNNTPDGYIWLNKESASDLGRALLNAFDDEIYPSE